MPASSPTRRRALAAAAPLLTLLLLAGAARAQGDNWPRQFDSAIGSFIVYQPQPETLAHNLVTARAAFSVQKSADIAPAFGVLWFQAHVRIDRDSSLVKESDLDVTRVRLPGATVEDEAEYEHLVENESKGWDLSGSLEELQAGLAASAKERLSIETLDHTPPRVLFSSQPALLVYYDGEPVLDSIPDSRLLRVANTPCAVVFDPANSTYYLRGANLWYRAANAMGPWSVIGVAPAEVAAAVPPDTTASDAVTGRAPVVITATEPTELIVTDGEPVLEPLVGKELFYVANTESDVLRDMKSGTVYVLISGRWYTAHALDDPWMYVSADQLPEIFKQIPVNSAKGNLLASVAGTDQADDAVADDQIPQTSAVTRADHGEMVTWDGPAQFEPVPGTRLSYGVNCDAEVILAGTRYYLCDQGVWYWSDDPHGPWTVSTVRPDGLDDLPPSCPVYNVRYVEIYGFTPDAVEVGYLPGYLGYYPCGGTVVYGTGYRYRPWRGRSHYFPRPETWGYHARYNPWLSRWTFGLSYWSGFLRVGLHWQATFGSHRAPQWFGAGGFHRPLLAADHSMLRVSPVRTRPRIVDSSPMNIYVRNANAKRLAKLDERAFKPGYVRVGRHAHVPDNVYADRDGNVYQRGPDGQWNVQDGGRWKPAPAPMPIMPTPGGLQVKPMPAPVPVQPAPAPEPVAPSPKPRPVPAPMPVQPVTPAPTPVQPAAPAPQVRPAPVPMPVAPPVEQHPSAGHSNGPSPGELERAFRARERANPEPVAEPKREAPPKQEQAQPREQQREPKPAPKPAPKPEPKQDEHKERDK